LLNDIQGGRFGYRYRGTAGDTTIHCGFTAKDATATTQEIFPRAQIEEVCILRGQDGAD